jgi:hypothetical protein
MPERHGKSSGQNGKVSLEARMKGEPGGQNGKVSQDIRMAR